MNNISYIEMRKNQKLTNFIDEDDDEKKNTDED